MDKIKNLFPHISSDQKERDLYEKMINAVHDYLEYIKPQRIQFVERQISGKVINPFHWGAKVFKSTNVDDDKKKEEGRDPKDLNMSKYRKLLTIFHPDKNPDRRNVAEDYFKYVMNLVEHNHTHFLDVLMNCPDPWHYMESRSLFEKVTLITEMTGQLWYVWDEKYHSLFISPEERLKLENEDLRFRVLQAELEVERLRRETKT